MPFTLSLCRTAIASPLLFLKIIFVLFPFFVFSQDRVTDTLKPLQLPEVVVKAYEQNRKLRHVPAAINYIGRTTLEGFNSSSIVSAVNTTPGVRMEERSPGSYRFNIRGSALRSPFGVRNVKVYFNDLPLTDPGGQTYLNGLGYYNFNSVEILKGPGSSLYGAGTGGVILIESLSKSEKDGVAGEYTTGSNGLQNAYLSLTTGNEKNKSRFGFQHQQSGGFRNHSKLERDVFSWTGLFTPTENQAIKTTFLYSNLFYETPGALTATEYNKAPEAARPAGGGFPGAEGAKASISQKTFLAGASFTQKFGSRFQNTTTAYGAFTELQNPAIRNYGKNSEPHVGARSVFQYNTSLFSGQLSLTGGGEAQQNFTTVSVHKNRSGQPDSLQTSDDAKTGASFLFAQASIDISDWTITAGASYNRLGLSFQRFTPIVTAKLKRTFSNEIAPRFSILRKWNQVSLYSSISKGFSPPTTAELLPSGSAINLELNAEEGTNYDVGFRGTFFNKLYVDANAFLFYLKNTIVQRRDAGGGDFYTNAGKTKQYGLETYLSYPLLQNASFVNRSFLWISHTWHHFRYRDFKQLNTIFSGNALPGIAPHTISTGLDVAFNNGLTGTLTYYFSDRLPLNDANTDYAKSYHLAGAKIGYEKLIKRKRFKLSVGSENLLNEKYSLGNDVNAFGGRYYNAAAERTFFASLLFNFLSKEAK